MAIRPDLDENNQNKTTRKLKYLLDFFLLEQMRKINQNLKEFYSF